MSKRGRPYYNPITQVAESVEGAPDLSRIEVFQDPSDPTLRRWCSRLVRPDGSIGSEDVCDTDRDRVIAAAHERWPNLDVFELQDPNEDSTWEGIGPSPRLWAVPGPVPMELPPAVEPEPEQMTMRVFHAPEAGNYVLLSDISKLLELWALSLDEARNPSGALALREAAETLSDVQP